MIYDFVRVTYLPWVGVVVLELNMAEMVSFGEVKGGDSVIVDLDSHGKLVIIRGSSSAAPRFREPIVL
ncbi:hypothetical protein MIMGU_mgv11b017822mg [Erythranthe guttata]|uniref:Uncharacterized protein n=1 Tax=Erythranthe guttata TaxID=4155 RepID=A0A022RT68_ERYGU|nr:hypothetical protein MIMGU_mgv11b017822mg [Erythranthe guttata]